MSVTYMCYQFEYEERGFYDFDPDGRWEMNKPTRRGWRMCGVGPSPRMAILDALHHSIEEDENFLSIFMSKEPTPYDDIKGAQYLGPDDREDTPESIT